MKEHSLRAHAALSQARTLIWIRIKVVVGAGLRRAGWQTGLIPQSIGTHKGCRRRRRHVSAINALFSTFSKNGSMRLTGDQNQSRVARMEANITEVVTAGHLTVVFACYTTRFNPTTILRQ